MKKIFILVSLVLILILFSPTIAQAIWYGQLDGIPSQGTVTYVSYVKDNPTIILTEDGFNTIFGVDQGYSCNPNRPTECYFLLEVSNLLHAQFGDVIVLELNGIAEQLGKFIKTEVIYDTLTKDLGILPFPQSIKPLAPKEIKIKKLNNNIILRWQKSQNNNLNNNLKYYIYRSTLPSGAENGHSNGRYELQTITRASFYIDRDVSFEIQTKSQQGWWYVIIAQNKYGNRSEHSEEVSILIE